MYIHLLLMYVYYNCRDMSFDTRKPVKSQLQSNVHFKINYLGSCLILSTIFHLNYKPQEKISREREI